jgi:adenosylmethionine-8-amino-7-oxononanoate aminotransferase
MNSPASAAVPDAARASMPDATHASVPDATHASVASPASLDRYRFTASGSWPTIVRAEGVELITDDGRRILDGAGGAVVTNIGHGRREVAEAVASAMLELDYVVPTWTTPNRLALADVLVERWLPDGFNHVFLAAGGSEANDSAFRLARYHHLSTGQPGRYKIIGRRPSYHGATLATLAAGGHSGRRAGYEPLLAEWPKARWDDADGVAAAIESAGAETVAAFIAEPVIGAAGGALVAPADYWVTVHEVCRHYGVLMIADEVMCGFGRTGSRWGHEQDPWSPDIVVTGKGLGGGYVPISMVSAHDRVIDPITAAGRNVMFFTYSGHDSACAGALKVLEIMERERLLERVGPLGEHLRAQLHDALDGSDRVTAIRGRGLMVGIELAACTTPGVAAAALDRGLWCYPSAAGAPMADAVMLAPPFVTTVAEIDRMVEILAAAIAAA